MGLKRADVMLVKTPDIFSPRGGRKIPGKHWREWILFETTEGTMRINRRAILAAVTGCLMLTTGITAVLAQAADGSAPAAVIAELAPTGKLRAAINLGNVVLAQKSASGELGGVSVDIARELARRLGKPVEFVVYDAAGKVTDRVNDGVWDICFLAIDPVRGAGIDFSAAYVLIEGAYMVAKDSPLTRNDDVDKAGTRIAVGRASAYDLYLTRAIKAATLVRAPSSNEAIELFVKDKLEVAAGVRQPLVSYVKANPGYRVLDGRPNGAAYLRQMIEDLKASGFIAASLKASNQPDAAVAPAAK
jgi:polar amino acid transport system substrate-binding protein